MCVILCLNFDWCWSDTIYFYLVSAYEIPIFVKFIYLKKSIILIGFI